jgi:hypothetical protein
MPGTPQGRSRLALTIVTSLTRKMALVRGPSAASVLFSPGQVRSRPASVASRRARLTPRGGDAYTSVAIEVYPSEDTRTETYRRTVGMSRALYSARPVPDSAHPVEERDVAIVRNSPSLVWWVSA